MSTAWAKGSTRTWRQLRLVFLERDHYRCQAPMWDGAPSCGRYADTAGHIVAKVHGGQDTPTNLRAECRAHNYSEGGKLAHAVRATIRRWTW